MEITTGKTVSPGNGAIPHVLCLAMSVAFLKIMSPIVKRSDAISLTLPYWALKLA